MYGKSPTVFFIKWATTKQQFYKSITHWSDFFFFKFNFIRYGNIVFFHSMSLQVILWARRSSGYANATTGKLYSFQHIAWSKCCECVFALPRYCASPALNLFLLKQSFVLFCKVFDLFLNRFVFWFLLIVYSLML